jgi:hypothetical protein
MLSGRNTVIQAQSQPGLFRGFLIARTAFGRLRALDGRGEAFNDAVVRHGDAVHI